MPIARTIVAGAIAIASLFRNNLIIKLKESSDYKEFPKQVTTYIKGPSDIMQTQL